MHLIPNFSPHYLRKLLLLVFLSGSLCAAGQNFSFSFQRAGLSTVFAQIEQQSSYQFIYTEELLAKSAPVTFTVRNISIDSILQLCFKQQPLDYTMEGKHIIVRKKIIEKPIPQVHELRGKVIDDRGEPVAGITIAIKNTGLMMASDGNGEFIFFNAPTNVLLLISGVQIVSEELAVGSQPYVLISVRTKVTQLDETIVMAYGTTSRRYNTGTIAKVNSSQIEKQPVSNPLATLQGRVPGLIITQANGLPGSGFSVMIRGRNSIQNGIAPLFIIDGVPFLSTDDRLSQRSSFNANNPFNTLNPEDILSIEILKDADATSIYGSRGANGVILVTTKRAKTNETRLEANVYYGWAKQTRALNFLNTSQYLQMRHEAFRNDGFMPDISNAPDLLIWDTTRNINWKKVLMGETANNFNANLRYNGGNDITAFTLGANYNTETTIFPGDFGNREASVSLSVSHRPKTSKLNTDFTASYTTQQSKLPLQNMGQYLNLPPHAMALYDSIGKLNWTEGGEYFGNPLANFNQTFTGNTQRFSGNTVLRYRFNQKFNLNVTSGYNSLWFEETSLTPISSQNPSSNPLGSASFGNSNFQNWSIEPQFEYSSKFGTKGKLQLLAGLSWQESQTKRVLLTGSGYTNDALIESIVGAATTVSTNSKEQYRYQAMFSRLNYNWDNKYIVNITARRDGSSRFGPDKRNANFGAVGLGWIFTNEKLLTDNKVLSFGKLRGSFGITGNDQISNYQYLDTWVGTRYPYQNIPGYRPSKLFNPNYSWEQIRKTEAAIELGFFNNRVLFNLNLFKSQSDNQIINYNLPSQTGFTQVLRNFPGIVENKGVEIQVEGAVIKSKAFEWSTSFNISVTKNKLAAFPGLESSSYAANYIIGKSLNSFLGYQYLGIDPQTGLYMFEDISKNGQIDFDGTDYTYNGTTDPRFYGGFQNTLNFKNFEFDFLFEFKKQLGLDNVKSSSVLVGSLINMPTQVLNRWQSQNSSSEYQRFSQDFSSDIYLNSYLLSLSNARLTDASFIRLKNLSLSYNMNTTQLKRIGISKCRLYLQAQNLFTITNYAGADPENQSLVGVSPMRVIACGIKLTF
ncbi:MAG: SusC/RagA family TonB-linked outer membrane protein [Ferruginibacter sp.]